MPNGSWKSLVLGGCGLIAAALLAFAYCSYCEGQGKLPPPSSLVLRVLLVLYLMIGKWGLVATGISGGVLMIAMGYTDRRRERKYLTLGKSKEATPNPMRETLFGDYPLDQWPPDGFFSETFPESAFILARSHLSSGREGDAIACWRQILQRPGLEPREYLQAWHFLRQHGQQPSTDAAKQVLGVVVEVAMPEGLDLLAAYPNHTARYYNYSGASIIWQHPDTSLDSAIDQLLSASQQVVLQLGPYEQPRPAPPPLGSVRFSFLTPSGLHFGQGPEAALAHDALGGQVLQLATVLLQALIAKQELIAKTE